MEYNILIKHYAGSISYGTNHKNSDVDYRGLFALDQKRLINPFEDVKEFTDEKEEDTKYYELSNYFKLVTNMNPNIIETLYVDKEHIVTSSNAYELLRENRGLFLNKGIAFSTIGMANKKLKSMKSRNKWVNNPQPVDPPKQKDYVSLIHNFMSDQTFKINLDDYKNNHRLLLYANGILALIDKKGASPFNNLGHLNIKHDPNLSRVPPKMILKFNKEVYEKDKKNHKEYWNWIKTRNEKRSVLEEKFGYDTKDAMHLVRVMRMGEEALKEGFIRVKRPDAKELMSILNGEWSYDKVLSYAENKQNNLKEILEKTSLPETPNYEKLADLISEVYNESWFPNKEKVKNKNPLKRP
jgi:predicted nucleotidyltransferase